MKKIVFVILIASLLPAAAYAKKTTYIVTNHRFNYVKLVEVKPRVAEARQMTHPKEMDEGQMRSILQAIKMSHHHLVGKEIDTQDTFDESSINFLAPALVKAFREAGPTDEVAFSFLMKNPYFIIRDDRINLGTAWIRDNELHIKFYKLYAKVVGDTDARGHEAKAVTNARGLRIDLELQPGQQMGVEDPEELQVDLTHNFGADVSAAVAKVEAAASSGTVEERLQRLDQLKKDKLITEREYKEKKKEILKDL